MSDEKESVRPFAIEWTGPSGSIVRLTPNGIYLNLDGYHTFAEDQIEQIEALFAAARQARQQGYVGIPPEADEVPL